MKPTPKYASRPTSDDPREVEAWALGEAARRLADAARDPDNQNGLREALQLNQRLWTIFQAAITEDDCPLPPDLRTNIAALSLMVDRETMARLVDLDVTKFDALININRNVSSGLYQKVEAQKAEGAALAGQQAPRPAAAPSPQPAPGGDQQPQPPRESLRISI